jgi:hypothetical protein
VDADDLGGILQGLAPLHLRGFALMSMTSAHSTSLRAEREATFLALKNAIVCLQDYIEIQAQE